MRKPWGQYLYNNSDIFTGENRLQKYMKIIKLHWFRRINFIVIVLCSDKAAFSYICKLPGRLELSYGFYE